MTENQWERKATMSAILEALAKDAHRKPVCRVIREIQEPSHGHGVAPHVLVNTRNTPTLPCG